MFGAISRWRGHLLSAIAVICLVLVAPPLVFTASAVDGFKKTYVIKKGDTLLRVAKRLKVTVKQLKRWNRLRRNTIRVGKKLVWYSPKPDRPTRMLTHVVKRGDTVSKLAKRYKTTKRKIQRNNRIRRYLRVGQKLKIEVVGPANPSVSTGRPQYGKLTNSEQLPKGKGLGWYRKKPHLTWGTNETITHLMRCIPQVKQKFGRRTPAIVIGDLSRKTGGYLPPHKSHQNGLDADIGYYIKGHRAMNYFKSASRKSLDVKRTWFLLNCFLETKDVNYIFVDYSLQRPLYEQARRSGKSKKWLSRIFQYPRSRRTHKGVIRHTRGHKNHFHIRFRDTAPPDVQARVRGRDDG